MLFVLSLVLVTFSPFTFAATINVPADQPTIQAGINAASAGDTVLVAPNTYNENIDFKGKAIIVTSSDGAATTIIDGGGTAPTVTFQTGEGRGSVLSNFTIRNGGPAAGTGGLSGGGIYIFQAAPTISNNIITANIDHCIEVDHGAALIRRNELSGTLGTGTALYDGAGVLLYGTGNVNGLTNSVIGNTIENNQSPPGGGGGGVVVWAAEESLIQGNVIRNNAAVDTAAGISSYNTEAISIIDNLIYDNSATMPGSGFLDSSGGISLFPPGHTQGAFIGILAGNTIVGNTVSAAIPLSGEIGQQVSLEGNLAQYVLVNNIVVGSSSAFPAMNCGTTAMQPVTPLVFDHNDIYNSQGAAYGGACPDQTGTYGNLSADPAFANAGSGNYQLTGGSPAVDAGNNSAPQMPATDIVGASRIQDATGKGYPVVDMGGYELSGQQDAAPTILTLTPSTYLVNGGTLTLNAQLTSTAGVPTGSVSFFVDGNQVGTQSVGSTGAASFIVPTMTTVTHALTATYSGNGSFPPAVSVKFYVIVQAYSSLLTTTTTLTSSQLSAPYGQSVTFTATVTNTTSTPGSPTGSVTFSDGATPLGTEQITASGSSAAMASVSISTLSVGTHNITASYTPTGSFAGSNGSLTEVITGLTTSTTVRTSGSPSSVGQSVTFTATVTNTSSSAQPTGSVTFSDGSNLLGTMPFAGSGANSVTVSFTTSTLSAATHTITAAYVPTGAFGASSGQVQQLVNAALTQDFTIALASPTITIRTQHHTTTTIILTSINGFADTLALSCANLPQYVTCQPKINPASLGANGTATVPLYLDTDSVIGYARLAMPASPAPRSAPISLALLLSPFSLFALALSHRSRRAPLRLPALRLVVLFLALLPVSLAFSGCGEIIIPYDPPPSAAPGTYTIPITATGTASHLSHTANLILIVTP